MLRHVIETCVAEGKRKYNQGWDNFQRMHRNNRIAQVS